MTRGGRGGEGEGEGSEEDVDIDADVDVEPDAGVDAMEEAISREAVDLCVSRKSHHLSHFHPLPHPQHEQDIQA